MYKKLHKYTYTGGFKDELFSGYGNYFSEIGDKYYGNWLLDKKHGHGAIYWKDGSNYVGNWKYNQMHGEGTFTRVNGNTYAGIFNEGKEPDEGIFTEKDGASFKFTRIFEIEDDSGEEMEDSVDVMEPIKIEVRCPSVDTVFRDDGHGENYYDNLWHDILNDDADLF